MVQAIITKAAKRGTPGVPLAATHASLIPLIPFGMSMSLFFVVTYSGCIVFYLLFPDPVRTHALLSLFLPGFTLLDWSSFFLGLVETFGFGWYVALVFGPLYNYFVGRSL